MKKYYFTKDQLREQCRDRIPGIKDEDLDQVAFGGYVETNRGMILYEYYQCFKDLKEEAMQEGFYLDIGSGSWKEMD